MIKHWEEKNEIGETVVCVSVAVDGFPVDLRKEIHTFQMNVIKAVLEEFENNRTNTAKWLCMKRPGLVYHVNKLNQLVSKSAKRPRLK